MNCEKRIRNVAPLFILTVLASACVPATTAIPTDTAPLTLMPTLPATLPATSAPTPMPMPPTSAPPDSSIPVAVPIPSTGADEALDVAGRLDPEAVIVFQGADGTLLFTDRDLSVVHTEELPSDDTKVSISGLHATYWSTDPAGAQTVTVLAIDGASSSAPVPDSTGSLVGYGLSPDGMQIAWLFDATEVRPSMVDGCDPESGCVGLIYDLVLTDSAGGQAQAVWNYVLETHAGVERLDLIGWREDSLAVFIGLDSGALGPFYPPGFDALYEVPLGLQAEVRDRSENYIAAEEVVISPDGRWLAVAGGPDSLTVESEEGQMLALPYAVYPNPYTAQVRFSPSAERLAWVELTTPERELSVVSLVLKAMSIPDGDVRSVVNFALDVSPSTLPLVGPWLTDDLLNVYYAGQSWVVDVVNGQAVAWPPQVGNLSMPRTLGVINPAE